MKLAQHIVVVMQQALAHFGLEFGCEQSSLPTVLGLWLGSEHCSLQEARDVSTHAHKEARDLPPAGSGCLSQSNEHMERRHSGGAVQTHHELHHSSETHSRRNPANAPQRQLTRH